MILLSQRDPRWSQLLLPPSFLTVGRYGCTSMCVLMLSDYFGCFTLPGVGIGENIKYNNEGKILWLLTKFPNFKFEWRQYNHSEARISESLAHKDKAVILTIDNDAHWVVALRKVGIYYWVADPWDGKKRFIRKSRVSGSAHFVRTNTTKPVAETKVEEPTEGEKAFNDLKRKGVIKFSKPNDKVTFEAYAIMEARKEKLKN